MPTHAPTPLRLCRATSLGAALFALAVGAAAAPPSHAQAEPARDAPGPDAAGLSVALEGSWVRNEELSDDPVANLADHFVEGFVSGWLRAFGRWSFSPAACSEDVPLVLGVAIDSSESMYFVWRHLHNVVRTFFEGALADDDRAFLVDFDHTVRPLQPLTASRPLLKARLHRLLAMGGTALNDGILFSLLQFRTEPGRRALVVVTDGNDLNSRSNREQVTEFAERMGVPIYFIALGWDDPPSRLIRRLSRQTGGRLFRIHPGQSRAALAREMEQVFDRINEDLRHQHVLTYYSEHPQGADVEPEVRTTRKGLTVKSVLPLEALQ